jgi:hypothetical protein
MAIRQSIYNGRLQVPFANVGIPKTFTVVGKSFKNITNVYLSGAPFLGITTLQNPFSGVPKLSAHYPPFDAIKLSPESYSSNDDNVLVFTMPSAYDIGFVDLIVENPAGYGSLTKFHIRNTYNYRPLNTPAYNSFKPYAKPWGQGVEVVDYIPVDIVLPEPTEIPSNLIYVFSGLSAIGLKTFRNRGIVTFSDPTSSS